MKLFTLVSFVVFSFIARAGEVDVPLTHAEKLEKISCAARMIGVPDPRGGFPFGRGMVGTFEEYEKTPEMIENASRFGMLPWTQYVYVVSDLKQAFAIMNNNPKIYYDPVNMPFFVVTKPELVPDMTELNDTLVKAKKTQDPLQSEPALARAQGIFEQVISTQPSVYYLRRDMISRRRVEAAREKLLETKDDIEKKLSQYNEDPTKFEKKPANFGDQAILDLATTALKDETIQSFQADDLPPSVLNKIPFDEEEDNWGLVPEGFLQRFKTVDTIRVGTDVPFFYQRGWFSPEAHAFITIDEIMKGSSMKDPISRARNKYARAGLHVEFGNEQDLIAVLNGAGNQVRNSKAEWGGDNFALETPGYVKMLREGKAFVAAYKDEQGHVFAGAFGTVMDGIIFIRSLYYPNVGDPILKVMADPELLLKESINFGKAAGGALLLEAQKRGVQVTDSPGVTETGRAAFKLEYRPRDVYLAALADYQRALPPFYITGRWEIPKGGK